MTALRKPLPLDLTSYDLFKCLALVLMVTDHIGYVFYPDDLWWRAFGRICVPIWMMLVGYARSRDISPRMWIGAGLVIAANLLCGGGVFSFNILVTILLCRLIIDRIGPAIFATAERLVFACLVMVALWIPTAFVTDYGTIALALVLSGYALRQKESLAIPESRVRGFTIFALVFYTALQILAFGFTYPQSMLVMAGCLAVGIELYHFQPRTYPKLTASLPQPLTALLRFCGRHTLEIYVAHLLVFFGLAATLGMNHYEWLRWYWIRP